MATKSNFPLSVIVGIVDKISAPLNAIGQRIVRFDRRISRGVANIGRRLGVPAVIDGFSEMGTAADDLGNRFSRLFRIAALGGVLIAGLAFGVKGFADAAGDISDTADRLGVGTEKLQEMAYAAKLGGVELEDFYGVVQKFNIGLGKAFAGKGGDAQKVLEGLGFNIQKLKASGQGVLDILPQVADKLNKVTNASTRAAAEAILFGKTGPKLQTLLALGSSGMAQLAARARELGLVMSDADVRAGEAFGDTLDTMGMAVLGLRNTIGAALLPTLQDLADKTLIWFVQNRPQIQAYFEQFGQSLPERIDRIIEVLGQLDSAFNAIGATIGFATEHADAIGAVLAFLAGAYIAKGILGLVVAVKSLSVALASTPVGWILLGVAALSAAAFLLIKNWDKVKAFFVKFWQDLRDSFILMLTDIALFVIKNNPFAILIKSAEKLIKVITGIDISKLMPEAPGNIVASLEAANAAARSRLMPTPQVAAQFTPDMLMRQQQGIGNPLQQSADERVPELLRRPTAAPGAGGDKEVKVTVDLGNLPAGSRTRVENRDDVPFELNRGFQWSN